MRRLGTILAFVAAIAVVFVSFAAIGGVLGESAYDTYISLTDGGTAPLAAALTPLLGADMIGLVLAFAVSFAGGVRLPSGLPHVFFALFVPLTLGAMQLRFFELAGNAGGLQDSFGAYNFAGIFIASVVAVQVGVHLARRRFESQGA